MMPWKLTALAPTAAIAAPIRPPMIAWLELDGIDRHHVVRFQMIAPTSAASTICSPPPLCTTAGSTIPLAMVAATLIEMNAPRKFRHPDMITATIGLSAPVAIEVATAFAVS